MTDPVILQRLYSSHGPLIDESLKLRLKMYRQRLRLVLTVSINSIVHVLVFFSVALLVRYLDVPGTPADITLSVVAVLIFASMAKTIIPALINHWRSESGIQVVAPVRRFRVHTLSQGPPVNAEFLFYLFMTPETSDALIGDLEEQYKAILVKFGKGRADLWYWTQTVQSLGSIVWWATKRVIGSLSSMIAFGAWRRN